MTPAPKRIRIGDSAATRMLAGMRLLARTAAVTLGPRGRHVAIEHPAGLAPRMTKDGVSVARALALEDQEAELGLRLLREAASAVSEEAGDGTTTAIILACDLATRCLRARIAGIDPLAIRDALARAATETLGLLAHTAVAATRDDLLNIACIAANGDVAVARHLIDAYDAVGLDGMIEVEMGNATEDVLEIRLGTSFETTPLMRELLPPTGALELDKPLILLYDRALDSFADLVPALDIAAQARRPLLIMADDVTEEVRLGLLENRRRGTIRFAAVKPPLHGDTRLDCLSDLALVCGGRAILQRDLSSLLTVTAADLGGADRVSITADRITLSGTKGDRAAIRHQIDLLRGDLVSGDIDSRSPTGRADYLEKRTERLKLLLGATAILHVGGGSDIEIKARLPLVENARRAMLAAAESGILPGGGTALLRASALVTELSAIGYGDRVATGALRHALATPARLIAGNAGFLAETVTAKILASDDPWYGFDARTGSYGDLRAAGIIDSLHVTQHVVHVAVSIAGSLLSTGVLICAPGPKGRLELPGGVDAVHQKLLSEGAFDS